MIHVIFHHISLTPPPPPPIVYLQLVLITECASKVGFKGGLVVDYPNSSKAKKYYLCLSFESSYRVPAALGAQGEGGVEVAQRIKPEKKKSRSKKKGGKGKEWVLAKKEHQRKLGRDVRPDTKYTARKRKDKF